MEQGFLDGMGSLHGLFAQGGFIFAGLILAGFGFALAAVSLRWKLRGVAVEGTVIGTRRHGKFFYPVYRYSFPYESESFEAMSDTGTTSAAEAETGTTVKLRVFSRQPGRGACRGRPAAAASWLCAAAAGYRAFVPCLHGV